MVASPFAFAAQSQLSPFTQPFQLAPQQPYVQQHWQHSSLFVKGLSKAVSERQICAIFSQFGTVVNAQVARHRSGRSAGFAIVTFARREEAQRAINLMGENENYSLHGRKLQIRWYTPEVQQGNMAAAQGVLNSLLSGRAPASDVANFDPSPWGAQTPLLAIQQALLASTQLETPTKAAEDALKALEALVSPRPGIDTSPLQHAAGLQAQAQLNSWARHSIDHTEPTYGPRRRSACPRSRLSLEGIDLSSGGFQSSAGGTGSGSAGGSHADRSTQSTKTSTAGKDRSAACSEAGVQTWLGSSLSSLVGVTEAKLRVSERSDKSDAAPVTIAVLNLPATLDPTPEVAKGVCANELPTLTSLGSGNSIWSNSGLTPRSQGDLQSPHSLHSPHGRQRRGSHLSHQHTPTSPLAMSHDGWSVKPRGGHPAFQQPSSPAMHSRLAPGRAGKPAAAGGGGAFGESGMPHGVFAGDQLADASCIATAALTPEIAAAAAAAVVGTPRSARALEQVAAAAAGGTVGAVGHMATQAELEALVRQAQQADQMIAQLAAVRSQALLSITQAAVQNPAVAVAAAAAAAQPAPCFPLSSSPAARGMSILAQPQMPQAAMAGSPGAAAAAALHAQMAALGASGAFMPGTPNSKRY